jgi:hypothetical protein
MYAAKRLQCNISKHEEAIYVKRQREGGGESERGREGEMQKKSKWRRRGLEVAGYGV